jgi:hypothetical protein
MTMSHFGSNDVSSSPKSPAHVAEATTTPSETELPPAKPISRASDRKKHRLLLNIFHADLSPQTSWTNDIKYLPELARRYSSRSQSPLSENDVEPLVNELVTKLGSSTAVLDHMLESFKRLQTVIEKKVI